tara:strand:- start:1152 stop:2015 length:864 start_codon:yes stop_codon:yes gene_type:complete
VRIQEFYNFMIKRENLRLRKAEGLPFPWSDDPILNEYKFTNVKRAHDRTTMWFWNVLEDHADADPAAILFNCALFRYFGTMEFYDAIGWQGHWDEKAATRIKHYAKERLANKARVFTGAYVITNQGISAPKQDVVVDHFLTPFWQSCPKLCTMARTTGSWEVVAREMMKLKGFGGSGFMTKEILQDALHTKVFNNCSDLNTYCPAGPGALRGLGRLLGSNTPGDMKLKQKDALRYMIDIFDERVHFWPATYVELELHDIQFQLCEFDKYERVRLGQGRPRSKYRVRD